MRTRHTAHSLPAFPVYSSAFLSENHLVLGGGGGTGKSGVKNRIRLYKVDNEEKMELLDELELGDKDAPMSMTVHPQRHELVCGINSAVDKMQEGENENCRVYGVKAQKIEPFRTCGTFQSSNAEDYQNVTVFSPDHRLLAVGSTNNEVALLLYPALTPAVIPIRLQQGNLHDVAFSSAALVVVATTYLHVYSLPKINSKGKGKEPNALKLVNTVHPPESPMPGMTFRVARFHPTQPETLYTILNASPPRTRGNKSVPRRAYICKWDSNTWEMVKIRRVGEKSVTCFDISLDGKMIAFGSSDYTLGILDSQTFAPLLTILKAHDFPPTTLRFNPGASLLISGSADNSVRVVVVPKTFGNSWTTTVLIVITILVLLLAVAFHQGVRV